MQDDIIVILSAQIIAIFALDYFDQLTLPCMLCVLVVGAFLAMRAVVYYINKEIQQKESIHK